MITNKKQMNYNIIDNTNVITNNYVNNYVIDNTNVITNNYVNNYVINNIVIPVRRIHPMHQIQIPDTHQIYEYISVGHTAGKKIILKYKYTIKKKYEQLSDQLGGIITEMTRYNTNKQLATNESNETFIKWCIECAQHDYCDLIIYMINDKRSMVYNLGFVYEDCTLLMYILFFIKGGLCSRPSGTKLAIKLIETGKSNHSHKMGNKTALSYAINYLYNDVAMELIKKGLSPSDRCFYNWTRVVRDLPSLVIPLIISGYCNNTFFQTETLYKYTMRVYATEMNGPVIQQLKYASQKNRVVQQMSRGRLILALKHYFKEGIYYPVDDTNSIYGKEYRKAMVRLRQ